jgi:hypothetical protein
MRLRLWMVVASASCGLVGGAVGCSSCGSSGATTTEDGGTDAVSDGATTCTLDTGAAGTLCGDAGCVDTANDPANCGGCGLACEAGASCSSGKCQNVAGSLSGLRWELPCTTPPAGESCSTDVDGGPEEVVTAMLSGATGTTYRVTLHFRGVVETRIYFGFDAGGAVGAEIEGGSNPGFFISGGTTPSLNDPYNVYELDISDPPQTYYLNSGPLESPFIVELVDYLATLPMKSGATVTLIANSIDGRERSNGGDDGGPVYVPGVPPYPQAFDGQFVQMDVTAVNQGP